MSLMKVVRIETLLCVLIDLLLLDLQKKSDLSHEGGVGLSMPLACRSSIDTSTATHCHRECEHAWSRQPAP